MRLERHKRICFKQIKYVLNKGSWLLLNEVYIYVIFPMLAYYFGLSEMSPTTLECMSEISFRNRKH